jgi:hypothetical protein
MTASARASCTAPSTAATAASASAPVGGRPAGSGGSDGSSSSSRSVVVSHSAQRRHEGGRRGQQLAVGPGLPGGRVGAGPPRRAARGLWGAQTRFAADDASAARRCQVRPASAARPVLGGLHHAYRRAAALQRASPARRRRLGAAAEVAHRLDEFAQLAGAGGTRRAADAPPALMKGSGLSGIETEAVRFTRPPAPPERALP